MVEVNLEGMCALWFGFGVFFGYFAYCVVMKIMRFFTKDFPEYKGVDHD